MTVVRYFRKYVFIFGLISILVLSSCVSAPKLNQPKRSQANLEKVTNIVNLDKPKLSNSQIRKKLNLFRKSLQKGKLNQSDWKLHDQLLDVYIELKQRQSNKIKIPAQSKLTLPLETYCLNSGRAPPSKKEIYHWQKSSPGIKYYKQLLEIRRKGEITQNDLQELLWNLENETRWDDYPNKLKAILQKIDPKASYKLPSALKDQATSLVTDTVLSLPGASETLDTYNLVKGQYYTYEGFRKSVESLTSKHELSDYQNLTKIPDTEIYSQSESNGFDNQTITFYNPTDKAQEIDLNEYYIAPERKDVQRIGVNRKSTNDRTLLIDLEKALFEDMVRLGIGFTPLIGDVADLYELFYGEDFVSGIGLSFDERLASGVGVILGSGSAYRHAKRWINSPSEYLLKFEESLAKTAKKNIGAPDYKDAQSVINKGHSKAKGLGKNLDYQGTKELSEFLRNRNIERLDRVDTVRSFEPGTISKRVIKQDETVYRWHNGDDEVRQIGRYVSSQKIDEPAIARSQLALPDKNKMKYLDSFTLKKGTTVFEGGIAPFGGQPGGAQQVLIPGDLRRSLIFKQRFK